MESTRGGASCDRSYAWSDSGRGGASSGSNTAGGRAADVSSDLAGCTSKRQGYGFAQNENTTFATDFHLYTTIQNPEADPQEYQLQPTKLSYKTVWHDPSDAGFTEVAIVGARVLTNNLR
jgi:hypothetical protein